MEIFKYISPTDQYIENIKNRVIYFQNPLNFNDPFDTVIEAERRATESEWKEYLIRQGNSKEETEFWINTMRKEHPKNSVYFTLPGKSSVRENSRVSCFSKNNLNILLWGHYADKHKGFCLGFRTTQKQNAQGILIESGQLENYDLPNVPDYFLPFYEIEYKEEMPAKVNPITSKDSNYIWPFFKTKFIDWKYEEEVRFLLFERMLKGKDTITYIPDTLESVVVGLKTSKGDIIKIRNAVRDSGCSIVWKKTKMHKKNYALEIEEIEDIDFYIEAN